MARLPRSFFARDTRQVARDLLGAILVRILPDGARLSGRIVETEAYLPGDSASHAYRGRTERNASMFMRPGTAYVYFTYGMHFCFNVVTEATGAPAAVLIRALEPLEGAEIMRANRARQTARRPPRARLCPAGEGGGDGDVCRGPARLCRALQIDRSFDGSDLCRRGSQLFLERGRAMPDALVSTSPRVGVRGGEDALSASWRWFVAGCPSVSQPNRPST